MQIRRATVADAEAISAVAIQTFALACPANTPQVEIETYSNENLAPSHFESLLRSGQCDVRVLDDGGHVVGFTLIDHSPEKLGLPEADGMAELTRCYVLPTYHGSGSAQLLLSATLANITGSLRLTVNDQNAKAIRFYARNGFESVGETTFECGDDIHRDIVMVRGESGSTTQVQPR